MALRQSVGELTATLISIVRTRIELFSLEAAGQKAHLIRLIGFAFAALLFLALAVLVFSVAVALYFWPSDHRYTALFVLALVYAVAGLVFFLCVRQSLRHAMPPFAATLEELQHDIAMVQDMAHPESRSRRHSGPGPRSHSGQDAHSHSSQDRP